MDCLTTVLVHRHIHQRLYIIVAFLSYDLGALQSLSSGFCPLAATDLLAPISPSEGLASALFQSLFAWSPAMGVAVSRDTSRPSSPTRLPPSSPRSVIDIIPTTEVWENIFRFLPLKSLVAASQTCRFFHQLRWPIIVVEGFGLVIDEIALKYLLSKRPYVSFSPALLYASRCFAVRFHYV